MDQKTNSMEWGCPFPFTSKSADTCNLQQLHCCDGTFRPSKAHLNDGQRGERLRSGVKMTIVGAPNVGKSSLLNFLSQRPTAIVSDIPGTTRDVIRTDLDIGGFPVNVQDTAGLRADTSDQLELEGMSRARAALAQTDLVLVVTEAQTVVEGRLSSYVNLLGLEGSQRSLIIANKLDLVEDRNLVSSLKSEHGDGLCFLSCRTTEGTDELTRILSANLKDLCGDPSTDHPSFSQPRHRFCLQETSKALTRFASHEDEGVDLAAQEVRNALHHLGKITGHVTTEDILDIIFKEFCIGK